MLGRLAPPGRRDALLEAAMATALGMGLGIVAFQALALAGLLQGPAVLGWCALGLLLAALQWPAAWRARAAAPGLAEPIDPLSRAALAALALVALPALLKPLAPPMAFDEMMYHLPYARQVAQDGRLGVYEWLRYPWFPYNINLLHAAALLVADDVLPHLVTGLAGAVSVLMLYRWGAAHAGRVVGAVAAAIWLGLGDYDSALIDMGVALFVLAACLALWWWRESAPGQGVCWLLLAAFLLGVAAGAKYQALVFLPLVAVFVGWRERRLRVWGMSLAAFLLPCAYWYARNAWQTGDPFNPIGAPLFGFSNWNRFDYAEQVDDVRLHAALPSPLLWPVLLAPWHAALRGSPALRAAAVFCAWSLAVWLVSSRYPRYLMASFPLLALMAALGWQALARAAWHGAVRLGWARSATAQRRVRRIGAGLLLAVLAVVSVRQSVVRFGMIAPDAASREAFLHRHVPGYGAMRFLREQVRGKVYQVGLSDALYYGPQPIWGDSLGPWRYRDYITLPPDRLARRLSAEGFEAIVLAAPIADLLSAQPGFDRYFAPLVDQDGAKAYRLLPIAP